MSRQAKKDSGAEAASADRGKGKKPKGKKAKREPRREALPAPAPPVDEGPSEPVAEGTLGLILFAVAMATVGLVAIWFSMDVNRVFDVPKALALKVGGAGGFLVWLLYGLFGRGFDWRSFRIYAAPVFALAAAVVVSTFFSLDTVTSIYGVYERQFGMQGFLACVGLYAVTSSVLVGKRGAILGLGWLAFLGGLIGTYALLQSQGWDPFVFFYQKPHNKVYSFLGNATFAGNALALIFPISTVLAIMASRHTLAAERFGGEGRGGAVLAWLVGVAGLLALEILPGVLVASNPDTAARQGAYRLTTGLAFALAFGAAGFGTWGPKGLRLASESSRRAADALGAGVLSASAVGIVMGLLFTRTRGAWVGSAVAVGLGLVLLPMLFRQTKAFTKIRAGCWGGLAVAAVLLTGYVLFAEKICGDDRQGRCMVFALTIRSIPAAFDPNRTDYGKGQGTRRFLWTESVRVLIDHEDTLERLYEDRDRYVANVEPGVVEGIEPHAWGPTKEEAGFDRAWRKASVWLFGIGIETYRFAFMSHKSKRLEALDPMTNHDNPHNNYLYILASFGLFGLAAYLWLLWRLLSQAFLRFYDPDRLGASTTIADRALAFGVLTSFFSYSVYSIAGFDSVACSVFLFFLLGCAAALFEPSGGGRPKPLLVGLMEHWALFRRRDLSGIPSRAPTWASALVALVGVGLLGHAVIGATRVYRAEKAFVGSRDTPARSYDDKIDRILRAIDINPNESYYRQELGSTYLGKARAFRQRYQQASKSGDRAAAMAAAEKMQDAAEKAKVALFSALAHAWAPENIYISLFQVYYHLNDVEKSKTALRWALSHSPHLGAVRANLAALELQTKDYDGALADVEWVLSVEPSNATALRTLVQIHMARGDLEAAQRALQTAKKRRPRDRALKQIEQQLEQKLEAATSTT